MYKKLRSVRFSRVKYYDLAPTTSEYGGGLSPLELSRRGAAGADGVVAILLASGEMPKSLCWYGGRAGVIDDDDTGWGP